MEKKCKKCRILKDSDAFYKTYGYSRYTCKKCEDRQRYEWRSKHSHDMKRKSVEYLGGKCIKCGYKKCMYALEFNHIQPKEKRYEPSRLFQNGINWGRIKEEIDKCELLCANCHREATHGIK